MKLNRGIRSSTFFKKEHQWKKMMIMIMFKRALFFPVAKLCRWIERRGAGCGSSKD